MSHYGVKNMDILQLIDRLEELFNAAKAVPFTHNVVVDEDRMLELIDQMRIAIPEEVKKAQQVLAHAEHRAFVNDLGFDHFDVHLLSGVHCSDP